MKTKSVYTIAAAVILAITSLYWLIQGIVGLSKPGNAAEIASQSLVPAAIMIVLLFLSWRKPLLGGILIAAFGVLAAIYFLMAKSDIFQAYFFLLPMCLPLVISGLLFIEADWSARKKIA